MPGRAADGTLVDTVDIDRLNPTATVNIVDTVLTDADSASVVTFTFSEAVDQDSVAIALENGTLSELTWNAAGTAATAIFTADDGVDGTGRVTVTSFTDLAGNAGTAAADGTLVDTVDIDRLNPTATVNIVDTVLTDADSASVVTFTFSEAVDQGLVAIALENGGSRS